MEPAVPPNPPPAAKKPFNHKENFGLAILTIGIWIPVWLLLWVIYKIRNTQR